MTASVRNPKMAWYTKMPPETDKSKLQLAVHSRVHGPGFEVPQLE